MTYDPADDPRIPDLSDDAVVGPNLFNIRTWRDVIAMVYVIVPLASASLVGYGVFSDQESAVIVGAVLAVLQVILQFTRTENGVRRAFYTVLLAANAVLVWYRVVDENFLTTWLPLINALLIGVPASVAVQNVNTSGDDLRTSSA
ncbi:putative holin [Gordonia phage GMA3]|uniref:Putative holin n=1 Tax=Gordonia phage GMA3 TaxID=1647284 RepID=A0A0K0NKV5_9CAUD|nr:holin [Gordonia phage GMA3]AKL88203.1 putative holin [Gordonia phage GMA3]